MHVNMTPPVVPDTLLFLLAILSIYLALEHLRGGQNRLYLAAFVAGLAIGTKYMFVAPAAFLTAKWLHDRERSQRFWDLRLLASLGACALGFFLATPYALIDAPSYVAGVLF